MSRSILITFSSLKSISNIACIVYSNNKFFVFANMIIRVFVNQSITFRVLFRPFYEYNNNNNNNNLFAYLSVNAPQNDYSSFVYCDVCSYVTLIHTVVAYDTQSHFKVLLGNSI